MEFQMFPITLSIIAITVIVSLIAFSNQDIQNKLLFYPAGMNEASQYYRFISHGLVHGDFLHLFVNMYTFYSFGRFAEYQMFSKGQYITLYVSALIVSSLFDFIKNRHNSNYAAVGASGAVSAVIFSYIVVDPWQSGICLFGVICLPNLVFGILYLVYCIYMAKRGGDNIGHNAHFWGSVYGFVFTAIVKPDLFRNFLEQLMHPHF